MSPGGSFCLPEVSVLGCDVISVQINMCIPFNVQLDERILCRYRCGYLS